MTHEEIDDDMIDQEHGTGSDWDLKGRIEVLETALAEARAALAAAREALRPFAKASDNFDSFPIKDAEQWFAYSGQSSVRENGVGAITVGDLRRSKELLARINALTKGDGDE